MSDLLDKIQNTELTEHDKSQVSKLSEIDQYKAKRDNLIKFVENAKIANRKYKSFLNAAAKKGNLSPDEQVQEAFSKLTIYLRDELKVENSFIKQAQSYIVNSWAKKPFPPFALTNANGRKKQTIARIQALESKVGKETNTVELSEHLSLETNFEDDRYRLHIGFKPNQETRTLLSRSMSLNWSRFNSAWQRKITPNAKWSIDRHIPELIKLLNDQ